MKSLLRMVLVGLLPMTLAACAHNYYNVPQETVESKVKVIGILPILVDAGSDIRHPEKEALVGIVKDFNRKNERELVRMVKESNAFFSVRFIEEDADQLYASLVERGERRDDAGIVYNKYFLRHREVSRLMQENALDGLMVVVVSGITHRERRHSSNVLSYLQADYNDLIMTAQMIDPQGTILWEYPNFRQRGVSFPTFFALQYPDFDEAAANETDKVDIKFKTIPGITRAFQKKEKDVLRRDLRISRLYAAAFGDMVPLLKTSKGLFGGGKKQKPAEPKQ